MRDRHNYKCTSCELKGSLFNNTQKAQNNNVNENISLIWTFLIYNPMEIHTDYLITYLHNINLQHLPRFVGYIQENTLTSLSLYCHQQIRVIAISKRTGSRGQHNRGVTELPPLKSALTGPIPTIGDPVAVRFFTVKLHCQKKKMISFLNSKHSLMDAQYHSDRKHLWNIGIHDFA